MRSPLTTPYSSLNSDSHLLITKDFLCNVVNHFTTVVTRDTDFDIVSAIFLPDIIWLSKVLQTLVPNHFVKDISKQ